MNFLKSTKSGETVPVNERLSDKAAAFGQHIIDLEESLAEAQLQLVEFEKRAKLAEADNERLKESLRLSKRDEDYFKQRWFETKAKLKSAASIILDAMQEEETDKYRPSPSSVRAVEKALATRKSLEVDATTPVAQIPSFLTKEPNE